MKDDKAGSSFRVHVREGAAHPLRNDLHAKEPFDPLGWEYLRSITQAFTSLGRTGDGRRLIVFGFARSAWLFCFDKAFDFRMTSPDYPEIGCELPKQILPPARRSVLLAI